MSGKGHGEPAIRVVVANRNRGPVGESDAVHDDAIAPLLGSRERDAGNRERRRAVFGLVEPPVAVRVGEAGRGLLAGLSELVAALAVAPDCDEGYAEQDEGFGIHHSD